jgi:hypothetical protein
VHSERLFLKSRKSLDFSDPYKTFPYIHGKFKKAGYIPVNDNYHRSVATSFCTVTNVTNIKLNGKICLSLEEYLTLAGNKTVFTEEQLEEKFFTEKNLVVVQMIYNGFFGKGNNITYRELKENRLFEDYPYNIRLTREQFELILRMGGKHVQHIIAD